MQAAKPVVGMNATAEALPRLPMAQTEAQQPIVLPAPMGQMAPAQTAKPIVRTKAAAEALPRLPEAQVAVPQPIVRPAPAEQMAPAQARS